MPPPRPKAPPEPPERRSVYRVTRVCDRTGCFRDLTTVGAEHDAAADPEALAGLERYTDRLARDLGWTRTEIGHDLCPFHSRSATAAAAT